MSDIKIERGKLRDYLLKTGMENKDYFKLENHKFSKGLGIKSEAKGQEVKKTLKLLPKQSEDLVRKTCITWLKVNGWECHTVFVGGVPLGTGKYATNPLKGHPDCICFNLTQKKMMYIEWKKSQGGIISQEQLNWHAWLKACGQTVLVVQSLSQLKEVLFNGSSISKAS